MKYFNTAGPCIPSLHYTVPPESRLPEACGLGTGISEERSPAGRTITLLRA